eukprot:4104332-Pyramimonas_sp.AAC.1
MKTVVAKRAVTSFASQLSSRSGRPPSPAVLLCASTAAFAFAHTCQMSRYHTTSAECSLRVIR